MIPFIILHGKLAHGRQKNWSPYACPAWQGEWKRHVKKESISLFLSLAVYCLLAVSIVLTMNLIQVQCTQILRRKIQVSSKGVRQTWPSLSPSQSSHQMSPIWVLNHFEVEQKKILFDQLLVGNDMSLWEHHAFNAWFFSFQNFLLASGAFRREERFPLFIVWI